MKIITDKTAIPLGLAVLAIGGGAVWLTELYKDTQANAAMIKEIHEKQDVYSSDIHTIREDIAEIKGRLIQLDKGE